MFDGLMIVSLIGSGVQILKESFAPTVPKENWANQELYYTDLMDGVSVEQRMKNLKTGRYKVVEKHPEPHRDANGKIIIENNLLFEEDKRKYGVEQAYKWVEQGKYNLTPEELKKEHERVMSELEYMYSLL